MPTKRKAEDKPERPRRATRAKTSANDPADSAKPKSATKSLQNGSGLASQKVKKSAAVKSDSSTKPRPLEASKGRRRYWLLKAEPESRIEKGKDVKFSIDDLRERTAPEPWDGVRNPVARNNMREMKKGDLAFFYHSNCKVPGIAGVMEIVEEAQPDESAFDQKHPYYDAKSDRENPKWFCVKVEFRKKFDDLVTLVNLKAESGPGKPLEGMAVTKMSRLSVTKVEPSEWEYVMDLAGVKDAKLRGS